jgi:hypothetical protein
MAGKVKPATIGLTPWFMFDLSNPAVFSEKGLQLKVF